MKPGVSSNDPPISELQKRFVPESYAATTGLSALKVAVNDTVAPAGSVVVCVMSSGYVRVGPVLYQGCSLVSH